MTIEDLDVVAVPDLAVPDAGRLVHARARVQAHHAPPSYSNSIHPSDIDGWNVTP